MINTAWRKRYRTHQLSQDRENCSIALTQKKTFSLKTPLALPKIESKTEQKTTNQESLHQNDYEARKQLQHEIRKGELLSASGAYNKALQVYMDLLELLKCDEVLSLPERVHLRGLVHMNSAWIYHQHVKDYPAAEEQYTEAIECLKPMRILEQEGIISALMISYRQRSQIKRLQGNIEGALKDLEHSATQQQNLKAPFHDVQEILDDWLSLATYQIELERWQEALKSLAQAEILLRSNDLNNLPSEQQTQYQQSILTQQAKVFEQVNQPLQALESYDKLLAYLDPNNNALIWSRHALLRSVLAFSLENHEQNSRLNEVFEVLKQLEEANIERLELIAPMLGLAELCQNESSEALKNQALDFYALTIRCIERSQQSRTEEQHVQLIAAYSSRAGIYEEQGQTSKALSTYRQAQRLAKKTSDLNLQADLKLKTVLVLQSTGKMQEAFDVLAETIALLNPISEPLEPGSSLTEDHVLVRTHYLRGFMFAIEQEEFQAAISDFEHVEQYCPGLAIYDIACLQVKMDAPDKAFEALKKHLNSKYALTQAEIEADSDLKELQQDPRWKSLWT